MAKRYDPIMCMMVDEPTKAQDELKIKKEDGLWCVYKDGKVLGQSNSEAGAIRIYNRLESGKDSASALDKAIKTCDASKADMDYWVGRYEKGCKSLIDAIKQGRSPIKTVQKAKQVISQDYDSHWKYLKDAFASYVVSTAKEEAKGDLSGMIDNTSKVEKREWKEFADREKKLMKAKNDALKSVEQAFK